MNTLIPLYNKNIDADTNSVNARELHEFILSKSDYSTWIKNRIKKYGFIENQDYIIIKTKKAGNNATLKEYYITLDMAKELSMVENNEKGREARRWFIEIAKKATATPTQLDMITPYEVRRDLATARRLLTIEKKKHRETAEFYENKLKSMEDTHLKRVMTKELDNLSQQLKTQFTQILENDIKMIQQSIDVSVIMMHKKITHYSQTQKQLN